MTLRTIEDLSTPEARGNRLRILRNMSGFTINELSEKYGIGTSTIKYWETAKQEGLSLKGAKKIISSLAKEGIYCSFSWLMYGVGIYPQYINSAFGEREEYKDLISMSKEDEIAIYKEIELFIKETSNSVTLTVYDNAMEPFFSFGDTVGGNRLFGKEMDFALGKNCIIETVEHQILCRKFEQGNEKNTYTLSALNSKTSASPPNIFDKEVISVAPISRIWLRSALKK